MFAYITLALISFYVNARVPSRTCRYSPLAACRAGSGGILISWKKRPKKRTRRKKVVVLSSGLLTSGNLSPIDSVVTRGREIMRDLCRPARSFDCYIFTVFCDGKFNRIVGQWIAIRKIRHLWRIWFGRAANSLSHEVSCWRCDSLVSSRATRVVSSKLEMRQLVASAISAFFSSLNDCSSIATREKQDSEIPKVLDQNGDNSRTGFFT